MMRSIGTEADKNRTLEISILGSVTFVVLFLLYGGISTSFDIGGVGAYIDGDNISNYLAILSIHFTAVFLTTGLMSTLGAKEDLVYHVDIVRRILLEPAGKSFKAYSVYAYLSLLWAVVALVFRAAYLVILAAVIGIVVVILLFFKMIRIYFEREKIKKDIKNSLKAEKDIEKLRHMFVELHLTIRNNVHEKKINPLVENIALLIELRQHFLFTTSFDRKSEDKRALYINDCLLAIQNELKEMGNICKNL